MPENVDRLTKATDLMSAYVPVSREFTGDPAPASIQERQEQGQKAREAANKMLSRIRPAAEDPRRKEIQAKIDAVRRKYGQGKQPLAEEPAQTDSPTDKRDLGGEAREKPNSKGRTPAKKADPRREASVRN